MALKRLNYHPKGWGYELWIHNDSNYCGKLLSFNKGKRSSLHYHKLKHETFYLQSGRMILEYHCWDTSPYFKEEGYPQESCAGFKNTVLTPGDTFEVPVRTPHRLIALEDSELFEFSTQHFDSDSHRLIKGD